MRTHWYRLAQVGKIINLFSVKRWVGGWVGVWRWCDDLEEEEEVQFLCTATGVLCFVFGKGGEICTGTEREREFRGMIEGSMSGKGE